jgi:Asp-tRNA(Asn)/Glu-tRNA(Gln) amidotransferase A subunit family amidase
MVAEVDAIAPDRWGAFVDRVAKPVSGNGPLAGLRLAVKDNIAVAGAKWTAGLPLLADRVAEQDAACVAVLRAAGACVVGTTATDAAGFGMMTPGVVNPLAPDRTAGGSSGGSAAAVAAGLADIALGTDTAGSVRVPAACCGLFGLKPTFGRVSVEGVTPLSHSFDHVGILSADMPGLERSLDALVPASRTSAVPQVSRIGFDPERLASTDRVIRDAIERVLGWLAAEGYSLVEVCLPDRVELAEMHGAIVCAEALEIWAEHWPKESARFADTARRSLAYAAQLLAAEVAQARARLPVVRAEIEAAMAGIDLLLGPTIAVLPPQIGARRVSFCGADVPVVFALLAETCAFNISGHPALSVPLPWRDRGIPVSVQIAARHDGERATLALARKLEQIGADI